MSELNEAPPMSGDHLPVKELKPEIPEPKVAKPVGPRSLRTIFILILMIFLFVGGLTLGIFLMRQKNIGQIQPSPSPDLTVQPSILPSAIPESLTGKLQDFEQKLTEVDLKEEQLLPPVLDFKFRFKLNE